jgi:uncharacterized membrane protein
LDALLGPWIAHLVGWWEGLLRRVHVVRSIYSASKDIVESATLSQRQVFKDVVLVEYPRKGLYSYEFVTSYTIRESKGVRRRVANVFLPGSPVPTTGVLVAVPVDELVFLQISTDEALKLILSIGMAAPDELTERSLDADSLRSPP